MSPLEALDCAIDMTVICDFHRRHPKPGGIVRRLRGEPREALKRLTSDDALKVRFDPLMVMDLEYEAQQEYRQMLRDFDQQLGVGEGRP